MCNGNRRFNAGSLVVALGVIVALMGCDQIPMFVPPKELFAEIDYVVSHRDDFAQFQDNPLAEVEAGTVIDDLSNLHGCWGAFDVFVNDFSEPIPILTLEDYEVYRFDTTTGEAEWQVLQEGNLPLAGYTVALLSRSGQFEVSSPDRVRLRIGVSIGNDPQTGESVTHGLDPEQVDEYLVTVSGDFMKLSDGTIDQRDELVFARFECNDPCRSQCELAAGECAERPLSEFANYQTTLEEWRARTAELSCEDEFTFVAAGNCEGPNFGDLPPTIFLFLHDHGPYVSRTHYFDADTQRFLSLTTTTDVIDPACQGKGYWPLNIECTNAVVTEVLCGSAVEVEGAISLP